MCVEEVVLGRAAGEEVECPSDEQAAPLTIEQRVTFTREGLRVVELALVLRLDGDPERDVDLQRGLFTQPPAQAGPEDVRDETAAQA